MPNQTPPRCGVSAPGLTRSADEGAATPFHRSKRRADETLLGLGIPCIVLQPSLVYGEDGASARLFATLASLPVIPLPGEGLQRVQPVHVDDVAAAVVAIVRDGVFDRSRVALVGPRPLALRDFLAALRAALGLGRARMMRIPEALVTLAANLRVGLFDRDAWRMLRRGNVADASRLRALLGRDLRDVPAFVDPAHRAAARTVAQLGWLLPLLRLSIAAVWIVAGIVSAFLYPLDAAYLVVKWIHILSSTVLFGTGIGSAFYMLVAGLHREPRRRVDAAAHARHGARGDGGGRSTAAGLFALPAHLGVARHPGVRLARHRVLPDGREALAFRFAARTAQCGELLLAPASRPQQRKPPPHPLDLGHLARDDVLGEHARERVAPMEELQPRHLHRALVVRNHHGEEVDIRVARVAGGVHVGHHPFHARRHRALEVARAAGAIARHRFSPSARESPGARTRG